jgi:triosephosphate isomerase
MTALPRRPIVAGNWKLHLGPSSATALARALREAFLAGTAAEVVVFPTAMSVPAVVAALADTEIGVGVQWAGPADAGAHTGHNSPAIAREVGCGWMLVGHSEARQHLDATDARVGARVQAALAAGLLPMVCVGESLDERDAGMLHTVLERQVDAAFDGLAADQVATCTLAYEPVWAIGTGRTASPEAAQEVHAFLRAWLRRRYPAFVADGMRILYGGSVKPSNAAELLAQPDIDGALVGGAALDAASFEAIVRAAG